MNDLANKLEVELGCQFIKGNRIEVLRNGVEIFPAMLNAIRSARNSIDMVTYVYWQGDIAREFAEALAERARNGVEVRLLLDGIGCKRMKDELVELMKKAGVNVTWFRSPARWKIWNIDNRTHRKILICDCHVAFTGGVGIAQQWEGDAREPDEWRDTHFLVEGPAVKLIHSGFLSNWRESNAPVHIASPAYPETEACGKVSIQVVRSQSTIKWSDISTLFTTALKGANETLWITTAYFVADENLTKLLCEAVQRGVDVCVLVPGDHTDEVLCQLSGGDKFHTLLNAGVKICRFQPSMLHAKIMMIDHQYAVIGSANMNQRSMGKDEELCLVVDDSATVAILESHFEEDLRRSQPLDLQTWKERPWLRRVAEYVLRSIRQEL